MAFRKSNKIFTHCWVPSHIGIHGNESANKLAVQPTAHALSARFEQMRSDHKAYINKIHFKKIERKME